MICLQLSRVRSSCGQDATSAPVSAKLSHFNFIVVNELLEEDSINPLPIIIDRKRPLTNKSGAHRARSATVSAYNRAMCKPKITGGKKPLVIPTMFVWETNAGFYY